MCNSFALRAGGGIAGGIGQFKSGSASAGLMADFEVDIWRGPVTVALKVPCGGRHPRVGLGLRRPTVVGRQLPVEVALIAFMG